MEMCKMSQKKKKAPYRPIVQESKQYAVESDEELYSRYRKIKINNSPQAQMSTGLP